MSNPDPLYENNEVIASEIARIRSEIAIIATKQLKTCGDTLFAIREAQQALVHANERILEIRQESEKLLDKPTLEEPKNYHTTIMFIPYPHDLITYSGSDFLRNNIVIASEIITILDKIAELNITEEEKLEATEKIIKIIKILKLLKNK